MLLSTQIAEPMEALALLASVKDVKNIDAQSRISTDPIRRSDPHLPPLARPRLSSNPCPWQGEWRPEAEECQGGRVHDGEVTARGYRKKSHSIEPSGRLGAVDPQITHLSCAQDLVRGAMICTHTW